MPPSVFRTKHNRSRRFGETGHWYMRFHHTHCWHRRALSVSSRRWETRTSRWWTRCTATARRVSPTCSSPAEPSHTSGTTSNMSAASVSPGARPGYCRPGLGRVGGSGGRLSVHWKIGDTERDKPPQRAYWLARSRCGRMIGVLGFRVLVWFIAKDWGYKVFSCSYCVIGEICGAQDIWKAPVNRWADSILK